MRVDSGWVTADRIVTMSALDRPKALIEVQTKLTPTKMRRKRWGPARNHCGTLRQRVNISVTGNLKTVSDIIGASYDTLTRAERQLAETLLDNYPVSGLVSITALAENARVSTPTVVRMVQKLGFSGFPDFQSRLHQELEETISNPISKHDRWAADAPGTHILNRFADAVVANMRDSLAHMSIPDFDRAAVELSNRKKPVYLAGGRITHALADYFFTHLQVIRSGVTLISTNRSTWPQYVLNMRPGNILVLFDIRRYEQEMETMAKIAPSVASSSSCSPTPGARHRQACQGRLPSQYRSALRLGFIRHDAGPGGGAHRGGAERQLGLDARAHERSGRAVRHDKPVQETNQKRKAGEAAELTLGQAQHLSHKR